MASWRAMELAAMELVAMELAAMELAAMELAAMASWRAMELAITLHEGIYMGQSGGRKWKSDEKVCRNLTLRQKPSNGGDKPS